MPDKEIQTLIQCYGVRKDTADSRKRHARSGDQVVDNSHAGFSDNRQIEMQQVIVIFVHRAVQSILYGNDGRFHALAVQAVKDILEALARNNLDRGAEQFPCGILAESAPLTLNGDPLPLPHLAFAPSQRRAPSAGRPRRSSTRSTEWPPKSRMDSGW